MSVLDFCNHLTWNKGRQYATFLAKNKTQYNKQFANREVEVIRQELMFDMETLHECRPGLFVVALKPYDGPR